MTLKKALKSSLWPGVSQVADSPLDNGNTLFAIRQGGKISFLEKAYEDCEVFASEKRTGRSGSHGWLPVHA